MVLSMKVAVLYSGGKDSTYTLWVALQQFEEVKIISVLSKDDSYLYHYQKDLVLNALEEAIDIPIKKVNIEDREKELDDLEQAIKEMHVDGILIGGLLSEYQRVRFNDIAQRLDIPCYAPLWRKDQELLLRDIQKHFTVIFSTIASMGFKKEDLGQILDEKMLERILSLNINAGLSIGGEGGEYETLVLDAPFYKRKIVIDQATKEWDETKLFGYYRIEKLHTEKKEKN